MGANFSPRREQPGPTMSANLRRISTGKSKPRLLLQWGRGGSSAETKLRLFASNAEHLLQWGRG
jgi:hypothetical protein